MERYSSYSVDFNLKLADGNRNERAVRSINVLVFAKDITEAMQKAWDAVRVTPEDYQIEQISKEGAYWSR